jgi:virulence factor Mce-like protein
MQKTAPSAGRILVMVAFALSCFGLLLFLWLAFGGAVPLKPQGYRFETSFSEATQLSPEADVRISGVSVGRVKELRTDSGSGRSVATIELQSRYAPLPRDARATLRQKTLLGETYVELSPGDGRRAGFLAEGGRLPAAQVAPTVELDEILRALDPRTRADLQDWLQSMAVATEGRGKDLNATIGNLAPFAEDTNRLLEVLRSQSGALRRVVANTGEVFEALSEREGQLAGLITNGDRVFAATAERNRELQEAFRALPTFERETRVTVNRLDRFARRTNPLISQLRPAARELSPTLQGVEALSPDLRGLFEDLGPAITASEQGLPATERLLDELTPFLGATDPVLRQLNPMLRFAGRYDREINAFLANATAATQATSTPSSGGAPLHYLRTTNPLNPENLASYPSRLGSSRTNPYAQPGVLDDLEQGLPSFETRHCGRPNVPTVGEVDEAAQDIITQVLREQVIRFAFAGSNEGSAPAAPCREQPPFGVDGRISKYPQVAADRTGSSVRAGR